MTQSTHSSTIASRTPSTPLLVAGLIALDGLYFVWARILHAYLPAMTAVVWYFMIASVQIMTFAAWRGKLQWRTFAAHWWFFLLIGALVATSSVINYYAIGFIDPGVGTLLAQIIVVYNLVLGVVWLKDKLSPAQVAGAALCLLGVVIISFQPGEILRVGSFMVIGGTFLYALHAAIVKKFGGDIEFIQFFVWRVLSTTLMIIIAVTITGQWQVPTGIVWFWLFISATADVVISRALYYMALRRLRISMHTLVLTLSPIMAALWSILLFGITPSPQQIIGGIAVIAGLSIVSLTRRGAASGQKNAIVSEPN